MELCVNEETYQIDVVPSDVSLKQYISKTVGAAGREDNEDPFSVVDLGRLCELYRDWHTALPTVTPFYAIKCNGDPALVKTLATLGTGFDCASKTEIRTVLELGVPAQHIIYANPCKQVSHLKYAAKNGVDLMTFDNMLELHKIQKHFPSARLVLRIRADDPDAVCQLGLKFGCSLPDGEVLLNTAKSLGLNVVGVSFHVGSGSQSPTAYTAALEMAAQMFQYGTQIGYRFSLLDIGGGFPGNKGSTELFHRVTSAINHSLSTLFSREEYPDLRVIAEPGRYFACSTHAIAVNVTSKRSCESEEGQKFMYYVNDGVYGSFNCILFDHVTPTPSVLKAPSGPLHPTSLWGPTCDGLDKILEETSMPELNIGDWMYFDNMGAYTLSASTTFNGFLKPKAYYYVTETNLEEFCELFPLAFSRPNSPGSVSSLDTASSTASLASSTEDLHTLSDSIREPLSVVVC